MTNQNDVHFVTVLEHFSKYFRSLIRARNKYNLCISFDYFCLECMLSRSSNALIHLLNIHGKDENDF